MPVENADSRPTPYSTKRIQNQVLVWMKRYCPKEIIVPATKEKDSKKSKPAHLKDFDVILERKHGDGLIYLFNSNERRGYVFCSDTLAGRDYPVVAQMEQETLRPFANIGELVTDRKNLVSRFEYTDFGRLHPVQAVGDVMTLYQRAIYTDDPVPHIPFSVEEKVEPKASTSRPRKK